jgi:hypothetical protein
VVKVVYYESDSTYKTESYMAKSGSGISGLKGQKESDDQILNNQIRDVISKVKPKEEEPDVVITSDED